MPLYMSTISTIVANLPLDYKVYPNELPPYHYISLWGVSECQTTDANVILQTAAMARILQE